MKVKVDAAYLAEMRAFVDDPEANGGLDMLEDCGFDIIATLLDYIDELENKLKV